MSIDFSLSPELEEIRLRIRDFIQREVKPVEEVIERDNLAEQDLGGADLTGANLSGANLTGAHLLGANLAGANLSGANLTEACLEEARADQHTQWPEGFDPVAAGVTFE